MNTWGLSNITQKIYFNCIKFTVVFFKTLTLTLANKHTQLYVSGVEAQCFILATL